ncbi:MAG: hypothetical protein H0V54_11260, partial [Chthoniobacterales bacterium]|nr:hypothetical protein [Chthoniobacterales bacterium]
MRRFIASVLLCTSLAQLAAGQRTDKIIIQGNPAGTQTVQSEAGGALRAEYSYNDRGRGDHITATWKVDAAGLPIEYQGQGNDYMKAPVEERFELKNGRASWKSRGEEGAQEVTGAVFYLPLNAPPEFLSVLARALLKAPDHRLALLPAGEARLERAGKLKIADGRELTQYRITGLGFTPQSIWLEADGTTAASASSWLSVVPSPNEKALPKLLAAQEETENVWARHMAKGLAHVPKSDLLIRNARLFDPRDLSVTPGSSVLVRGDRIARVGLGSELKAEAGIETID